MKQCFFAVDLGATSGRTILGTFTSNGLEMEEVSKAKHYIAVNAGGRYPLLKTAQDYTEYFHEALSFSDLYETYRYIEKHGLEKIATVITRMI